MTAASQLCRSVPEMYIYELLQNLGFELSTQEISLEQAIETLIHYSDNAMETIQMAQHIITYSIHDSTLDSWLVVLGLTAL